MERDRLDDRETDDRRVIGGKRLCHRRSRNDDIVFAQDGDATGNTVVGMVFAIFNRVSVGHALSHEEQQREQGHEEPYASEARHGALSNYIIERVQYGNEGLAENQGARSD